MSLGIHQCLVTTIFRSELDKPTTKHQAVYTTYGETSSTSSREDELQRQRERERERERQNEAEGQSGHVIDSLSW